MQNAKPNLNLIQPRVVSPRSDTLGLEPATNRAGRDSRQLRRRRHKTRQFAPTPTRQRNPLRLWQAASDRCGLRTYLRGKNASALQNGARQLTYGWQPNALTTCGPVDHWCQRSVRFVGYSTLDAHELLKQSGHELLMFALYYARERVGGVVLLLSPSMQSDDLVWDLSLVFPSQAQSTSLSGSCQSRNEFMRACTKYRCVTGLCPISLESSSGMRHMLEGKLRCSYLVT